jgi:hypothetical protein
MMHFSEVAHSPGISPLINFVSTATIRFLARQINSCAIAAALRSSGEVRHKCRQQKVHCIGRCICQPHQRRGSATTFCFEALSECFMQNDQAPGGLSFPTLSHTQNERSRRSTNTKHFPFFFAANFTMNSSTPVPNSRGPARNYEETKILHNNVPLDDIPLGGAPEDSKPGNSSHEEPQSCNQPFSDFNPCIDVEDGK